MSGRGKNNSNSKKRSTTKTKSTSIVIPTASIRRLLQTGTDSRISVNVYHLLLDHITTVLTELIQKSLILLQHEKKHTLQASMIEYTLQKTPSVRTLLLPKAVFQRLVRSIVHSEVDKLRNTSHRKGGIPLMLEGFKQNLPEKIRIEKQALLYLQYFIEHEVVRLTRLADQNKENKMLLATNYRF